MGDPPEPQTAYQSPKRRGSLRRFLIQKTSQFLFEKQGVTSDPALGRVTPLTQTTIWQNSNDFFQETLSNLQTPEKNALKTSILEMLFALNNNSWSSQ